MYATVAASLLMAMAVNAQGPQINTPVSNPFSRWVTLC